MTTDWSRLRSDIYLRDKGICWICNTFVDILDYELGHLVDRANGGHDDYDNLAVMHKDCNRSKPYHKTLDECLRWKLTYNVKPMQASRGIFTDTNIINGFRNNGTHRRVNAMHSNRTLLTPQEERDKLENYKSKIKPATICWIQGRPYGGAMWKVLPPPYRQEDFFSMRLTPPGAIDNGKNGVRQTIQVIGGELKHIVRVELGSLSITVIPDEDKPIINFKGNVYSNAGERSKTIGIGKGQIPVEEWRKAKSKGITFKDFVNNYKEPPHNLLSIFRRG